MTDEVKAIYKAINDSREAYEEAQDYADHGGDLLESDPVLRHALGGRDLRFNFTGAIVRAYTSQLLPGDMTISTMNPAQLSDYVDSIYWAVQLRCHIQDLCKYGDAYLMTWKYEENGVEKMTVRAVDPVSTRVFYDPEDDSPELAARSWCEYEDGKKILRVNIYDDKTLSRWYSTDGETWVPYIEIDDETGVETPPVIPHDFGKVPIFHSRTSYPYGKPVHFEAYGPQDMIMRTAVAHASAIDFQGWPQIYALYEMGNAGGTSALGDTRFADQDGDDRTEVANLRRDPGSIWALHAKSLGQLQPAASSNFLDTLDRYIAMAANLTGTPENRFSSPGGQQPSAESQSAADASFRQVVRALQEEITGTVQQAHACAQTSLGNPTQPSDIDLPWRSAEIINSQEFWATVDLKQQAGVSVKQTLIEGGYQADQVDEFLQDSGDEASLERRVGILNTMAGAISQLAAAASTGFIDQVKIMALVEQLFGSVANTDEQAMSQAMTEATKQQQEMMAEDSTNQQDMMPGYAGGSGAGYGGMAGDYVAGVVPMPMGPQ